jgi:lipid-A-disaccharide synthase-like uncharacterized protein
MERILKNESIPSWLIVLGVVAQLVFTLRFVYQWIYAEKHKSSELPKGFWWLSLAGSCLILIYAILRKDPVLLTGHLFGAFVYVRNLSIIKKGKHEAK